MSPRTPAVKPPKDWEREEAGTYRSADRRFSLEGDGSGRWFVRDEEETDELGLPRTTGPYPTLAAAKAAATDHRGHRPEPSPLAERLRAAKPRGRSREGNASGKAPATARAEPRPAPPRAPTWLETLEAKDRDAAKRARQLVHDLEGLGIDDADGLVRRDVLGRQPEVAKRLLIEAVRRAMAGDLAPDRLVAAARRAGIDPRDPEALAADVVARTLGAAVDVLAAQDRLSGSSQRLPGWELLERGPERRRLRLTADDLA